MITHHIHPLGMITHHIHPLGAYLLKPPNRLRSESGLVAMASLCAVGGVTDVHVYGRVALHTLRVDHGCVGFMLPLRPWMRMLEYFPFKMASRLMLRDMVCASGKALSMRCWEHHVRYMSAAH